MKRTEQLPMTSATAPELPTITPGDVRRLLAEAMAAFAKAMVAFANGEITAAELERTKRDCNSITRDCNSITRELNRGATAALRLARLAREPKPRQVE